MSDFDHSFTFDPGYGYGLPQLLEIESPEGPTDFAEFWKDRYHSAITRPSNAVITNERQSSSRWNVFDLSYISTDDFPIKGWALIPKAPQRIRNGFICLHGYGGITGPDFNLPFDDSVILFPCLRGLSKSSRAPISSDPNWHVLHDLDNRDRYIHGGCVEDVWLAVSALIDLYPEIENHISLLGVSFGGGIGMMALPWENRINRAHFEVPSFGNHPLRLQLETIGSGAAVIDYHRKHENVLDTLRYYDAATAARFTEKRVSIAAALFDPLVAPPGQFSIYNNLKQGELFVLDAGHFDYPNALNQRRKLKNHIAEFFTEV